MQKYSIKPYISEEDILKRVEELAKEIDKDFEGEEVLLIGLLRGSVVFLSDLCRKLKTADTLDFMVVSSYGNGMESSRNVKIIKDLEENVKDRNVLIVEDIIDTGNTLKKVKEIIETREPKKIKIVTLLDKPERREVEIDVQYIGFEIPNEFVVGYGLDYNENYRNLPYVGVLKEEVYSK